MPPASASRNNSRHRISLAAATPLIRPLAPATTSAAVCAPRFHGKGLCRCRRSSVPNPPTRRLSALPLARRLRRGVFFAVVRHGRSPHPDSLDPRGQGCGRDCVRHFLGARARVSPAGVKWAPMPGRQKANLRAPAGGRRGHGLPAIFASELNGRLYDQLPAATGPAQTRGANYGGRVELTPK
jgi:hypothetical protein